MDRYSLFLLLSEAREKNLAHDITGLLLYDSGKFIQVIEGAKADIDILYDNISRDSRIKNIRLMVYKEIESRNFEHWHMGFVSALEQEKRNIIGLSRFLDSDDQLEPHNQKDDEVLELLLAFRSTKELRDLVGK